jgi:hypothetical protein
MPTRPTTGILTPRKVTTQPQLVVPSNSSDDDLSLVKYEDPLHPGAYSCVGLTSAESAMLHCVGAAGTSGI